MKTILALLLLSAPVCAAELNIHELIDKANKALRGDSSHGRLIMTIETPEWKRSLEIEGWNKDRTFAFIKILAPAKERGNTTLRRVNEMWVWLPKVERVIKIPPTMMHSTWQGSDFTYEDIVKADSIVKDYTHKLLKTTKEEGRTVYHIEATPKPDAPVVWGKVLTDVALYDEDQSVIPVNELDYSERGELIRTITLSDVKVMSGRRVPARLECVPAKKKGQRTILQYQELQFDIPLGEEFFSYQRLQKGAAEMLRLAWRNVWRNRRRSLINVAAMGFGLAAIMFGQSMMRSLQTQLIQKATGSITGHVRIQRSDVDETKFPDKFMADPEPAGRLLDADPRVAVWGRRIQMTGLVSSPNASLGALICAVEPEKEKTLTDMHTYIKEGTYLDANTKGIIMGRKIAGRLDVRLGEKVVLMAQAADGSMGAEAFRVVGLQVTGSESFDGQIVWIPLKAMQEMLGRPGQANQLAARVKDIELADQVAVDIDKRLPPGNVRAISWKQIDREIIGIQAFQNGILSVVLVIVFAIVALGILNTQLMSLFERVREFGVLMAIGARPRWIVRLILAESLVLGSVGALLGLVIGAAMIAYFGRNGLRLPVGEAFSYFLPFPSVIYLVPAWRMHAFACASVFVITLLASLPPALRAGRLKPAEALRHV